MYARTHAKATTDPKPSHLAPGRNLAGKDSHLAPQHEIQPLPERDRDSDESSTPAAGNRPLAGFSFGNLAIGPKERLGIQTKLTIGQPDDRYEQEADRVADQVMRMPDPAQMATSTSEPPSIQRLCPECEEDLQRQPQSVTEEDEKKKKRLQTKPLISSVPLNLQQQVAPTLEEDEKKKKRLQRKSSSGANLEVSPDLQARMNGLHDGGQPLSTPDRAFLEPRFGYDFSQVRLHTDERAAEMARSVNARAFTLERDVVFGAGQYQPRSTEGQRLLAHELTHVVQQTDRIKESETHHPTENPAKIGKEMIAGNRSASSLSKMSNLNVLQRVPAAPSFAGQTGLFDRSKVIIGELLDIAASIVSGNVVLDPPATTATVSFTDPNVSHLSWELYNPSDQFVNGMSTTKSMPTPTSLPYVIEGHLFNGAVTEGRYTLRCVGRDKGKPIVFADRTFYIWTNRPTSMQNLASLQQITSSPANKALGEVGAARARSMMLEHQEAVAATGTGKYMGTVEGGAVGPPPQGVSRLDCTSYVLEVLKYAFKAKGLDADWQAVYQEAQRTSAGKFKGTELLKALESKAGWKGVFWAPDPRNPEDKRSEHPDAYKKVRDKGTYYGIAVDKTKSAIDYRPTSATKPESMTRLDQLRRVPLAVIAARGGTHMTLLLNGIVYEVHWDKSATDPNVIEATQLEKWIWQSGVVVMPPADFSSAFGP